MNHLCQMSNFTLTFIVHTPQLLREAIAAYGVSKRALTAIKFTGGKITVNGVEQNVRYPLQRGDEVILVFPQETRSEGLVATYAPLTVLYEDDALLIINKPAQQNTIPSREHPTNSVANDVCGYFEQQGLHVTAHIVTRLDRDTSGIVCIAKHRHVHHLLSEMQKRGELTREYEALATGRVNAQCITAPIGRAKDSIIAREVCEDGQSARTDVTVVKYANLDGAIVSHVKLALYTGRTHQIRVHLAHIGHPLLGDTLYGGDRRRINRQALHCSRLMFIHPLTKVPLSITSALPVDMAGVTSQKNRLPN